METTGIPCFFSSATGVWDLVFFMPSSGGARFLSSPGNLSQLSACSPVGRGWGKAVHPRTAHYPEHLNHKTAFCVLAGGACICTFFFSSTTGVQDFCFSSATGVLGSRFLMPSSGGARFFIAAGQAGKGCHSRSRCRCRCLHWRMHAGGARLGESLSPPDNPLPRKSKSQNSFLCARRWGVRMHIFFF